MRRRYFVTYDICDPKRLRRVFKAMKGAGAHVQLSVFRCELSDRQLEELISELAAIIQARADQILFVDIGAVEATRPERVRTLGRPYTAADRPPSVV